jgi:flagella basal body P-ring formation protein FlgA
MKIGGLVTQYPKGPARLKLSIVQGSKEFWTEVICRFDVRAQVLVSNEKIKKGDEIGPGNCMLELRDITTFARDPITSWDQCKGTRATRTINPGRIIHPGFFEQVPAIERGDQVKIVAAKGNVAITVDGIAKESGATGDKIWVENTASNKLIRTKIIDKGEVRLY